MEGKKLLMLLQVEYFQKENIFLSISACAANVSDHKQLKILIPKQMLQRLPMALA